jgi:hypothetical protein
MASKSLDIPNDIKRGRLRFEQRRNAHAGRLPIPEHWGPQPLNWPRRTGFFTPRRLAFRVRQAEVTAEIDRCRKEISGGEGRDGQATLGTIRTCL